MLPVFDFSREIDFIAVFARIVAAAICGGIIGIEREFKRRPAGFRTHILISIGAALTMIVSEYLYRVMFSNLDVTRISAGVVSGIGFVGGASIMITKQKTIKGLTTAAGLWTTAIIGICCGAGYLECSFIATLTVSFVEVVFSKLEYRIANSTSSVGLTVNYRDAFFIEEIVRLVNENGLKMLDLEVSRLDNNIGEYSANLTLRLPRNEKIDSFAEKVAQLCNVISVEKI